MTVAIKRKNAPTKAAGARLTPGVVPAHKKHFSVAEAAAILDTSSSSVYRDVRYGFITKLPRRGVIRIPRGELERILDADGDGGEE